MLMEQSCRKEMDLCIEFFWPLFQITLNIDQKVSNHSNSTPVVNTPKNVTVLYGIRKHLCSVNAMILVQLVLSTWGYLQETHFRLKERHTD